ncbi:MAG TPA: LytTR family DNA-binding domain-containing protein [Chitinophagaceae bacterium]|nr:LytTR family DNA-binding domain-containing protein [Chitinophagaceae bacterium]
MNRYKCLIIEDEPLAQNVLKKYIGEHPTLELIAVCNDALEAQGILTGENIHLLFLDINLPKLSGINFIKTLTRPPLIIFTTAYPEFAVEGFELNAVDYLLKPFSFERFLKAVNKAMEKLDIANQNREGNKTSVLFLKADKKIHRIELEDIHYIEAIGDYMKVVTDSGQLIINETMKKLQEELPERSFIRVHKSFIISRDRIKYIEGNYVQVEDKSIPIGATYRNDVLASIEKKD